MAFSFLQKHYWSVTDIFIGECWHVMVNWYTATADYHDEHRKCGILTFGQKNLHGSEPWPQPNILLYASIYFQ
jgi:hypothetical protein